MFYYGVLVFKNGTIKEFSASTEDMLKAKCDVVASAYKCDVEKLNIYTMKKVREISYEE